MDDLKKFFIRSPVLGTPAQLIACTCVKEIGKWPYQNLIHKNKAEAHLLDLLCEVQSSLNLVQNVNASEKLQLMGSVASTKVAHESCIAVHIANSFRGNIIMCEKRRKENPDCLSKRTKWKEDRAPDYYSSRGTIQAESRGRKIVFDQLDEWQTSRQYTSLPYLYVALFFNCGFHGPWLYFRANTKPQ